MKRETQNQLRQMLTEIRLKLNDKNIGAAEEKVLLKEESRCSKKLLKLICDAEKRAAKKAIKMEVAEKTVAEIVGEDSPFSWLDGDFVDGTELDRAEVQLEEPPPQQPKRVYAELHVPYPAS